AARGTLPAGSAGSVGGPGGGTATARGRRSGPSSRHGGGRPRPAEGARQSPGRGCRARLQQRPECDLAVVRDAAERVRIREGTGKGARGDGGRSGAGSGAQSTAHGVGAIG